MQIAPNLTLGLKTIKENVHLRQKNMMYSNRSKEHFQTTQLYMSSVKNGVESISVRFLVRNYFDSNFVALDIEMTMKKSAEYKTNASAKYLD